MRETPTLKGISSNIFDGHDANSKGIDFPILSGNTYHNCITSLQNSHMYHHRKVSIYKLVYLTTCAKASRKLQLLGEFHQTPSMHTKLRLNQYFLSHGILHWHILQLQLSSLHHSNPCFFGLKESELNWEKLNITEIKSKRKKPKALIFEVTIQI